MSVRGVLLQKDRNAGNGSKFPFRIKYIHSIIFMPADKYLYLLSLPHHLESDG